MDRNLDWEAFFDALPEDVNADVPVIASDNYGNNKLGGITESRLEGGYWMLPKDERGDGFENTANYVFSFGYLVRDFDATPDVPGRLRLAQEALNGGQYETFRDFDLELIPSPAMAACSGTTGIYSKSTVTFIPESRPAEIPAFDAFFLDNFHGGQGLSIQLVKMEYRTDTATGSIKVDDLSGMKNLAFKMYDTAVAMAITE